MPYDKRLVVLGLDIGEIMHVSVYISFHGRIMIEKGLFSQAKQLVSELDHVSKAYSHDFARALKYYLNTIFLLKHRKLHAALIEAQEGKGSNHLVFFIITKGYTAACFSILANVTVL